MNEPEKRRLYFLDNVRWFVILFVILQHAALLYTRWDGSDSFAETLFRFIVGFTDVFMMPLLFFIAGYFALASIRKQGPKRFMRSKLKRIALPWFAGLFLVLPVSIYFMDMHSLIVAGKDIPTFGDHFIRFMGIVFSPHTGFVQSGVHLSPRHLWFLTVLFSFFTIFAAGYAIVGKNISESTSERHSDRTIMKALAVTAVLTTASFFLVSLIIGWGYKPFIILNLIYFDLARTSTFIAYFLLGAFACSGNWFESGGRFAGSRYWNAAAIFSLFVYTVSEFVLEPGNTAMAMLLRSLIRTAFALSVFVAILDSFGRYFDRRALLTGALADNSYTVYIIHYILHGAVAVLIDTVVGNSIAAMFGVLVLTTVLSYGISIYAVRPHPRISALLMGVVTIVLIVF